MITQARLKELLHYDPETGVFTWLRQQGKRADIVGRAAGFDVNGYVGICVDYKKYPAHHLAWLYVYGRMPRQLDHRNRIRSDNRISNLRESTQKQNTYNQSLRASNKTGHVGVGICKQTGKYRAHITVDGKMKDLGRYADLSDAVRVRREAEISYFGEFASSAA